MAQVLQNAADLFFTFGVSLPPDGYGVVKNNMVNVLKDDAELVRLADPWPGAAGAVLQGLTAAPTLPARPPALSRPAAEPASPC